MPFSDSFVLQSGALLGTYLVSASATHEGLPTVHAEASFQVVSTHYFVLSPTSGPPGTHVTVSGSNYAGTTCTLSSSPTGLFTLWSCSISAGTLTGGFTVTATGASASYVVTVTTDAGESATATFYLINDKASILTVETDKPCYAPGEVVHISGEAIIPSVTWTYTWPGGLDAEIHILDSTGNIVHQGVSSREAAGYKRYAYYYVLESNATPGDYAIHTKWVWLGFTLEGQANFCVTQVTTAPPPTTVQPPSEQPRCVIAPLVWIVSATSLLFTTTASLTGSGDLASLGAF